MIPLYSVYEHGKFRNISTIYFSINRQCTENLRHHGPQHLTKLKYVKINRFGDKNRVNSSNFNPTILKFSEKLDHQFSRVFRFGNMFTENHGFVAMRVTSFIKNTCSNLSLSN